MRRRSLTYSISSLLAVPLAMAQLASLKPLETSAEQEYCNEKYTYCVRLPNSGKPEPHEGDEPNHGVVIKLPKGNEAWTYAHWDAALMEGSRKVALNRLEVLLEEHPSAEVSLKRTKLATISAYRIRVNYQDSRPTTEDLIVGYAEPKDKSKGPGIVYEIGLKCDQASYSSDVSVLEALIGTFRQTDESSK